MNRQCKFMAKILMLLVFVILPVTAPEAAVDPELVGLWHMDGNWMDSSGNANHGTSFNGTSFSSDSKVGISSGKFNGTNNYVRVKTSHLISNLTQSSIEAWIYPALVRPASGSFYTIYGENSSAGTVYFLGINSAGKVTFANWRSDLPGNWQVVNSTAVLSANQWYHVVGTIDSSGMKIYINNLPPDMIPTNKPSNATISEVGIGRVNNNGGINYFAGLIDEVTIYKRALSVTEIQEKYRTYAVKAPTVTPVTSPTATSTITLSGTKQANTAIVVNGNTLVPLDAATSWLTSFSLTPGINTLNITAQDNQNLSSLPVTLTVELDTTPPVSPGIDPFFWPINSASATVSGTKSSDSTGVIVSGSGGMIGTVYYPTATTWFVNVSGLKEGNNTIAAYAVDAAGNQSSTNIATIIVDTIPPAVGALPVGGSFNSSQSVVISTSEPANIHYTTDGSTPTESSATYSQAIEIPASATLKFFARDQAGNSSAVVTENYVIDTNPPILTISTLSDGAYTNNEILNIAGTVMDDTDVSGITVNDTEVQVNEDGSFSCALLLKNGANAISVTASDSVGNMATDMRVVTLDQTAPILIATTPADNSKTGEMLLGVSGTVDKTSTVTVKMKDVVQNALMDGGAFTATIVLESGYNTIEITATDLAGNQSSLKRTVLYDDQKPSLAIIDPNQDIRTNRSSLSIKGTVNDTLTAVGVTITKDDEFYSPPVIDGTFEQSVNFSEEKTYNIVVTATNEVGTSTSVQRNIIYDITPPAFSIDPVLSPTCLLSQRLKGTREAGASVTISCATATVGEVSYPTDTTWQAEISGLRKGRNVITATSVDEAGNSAMASAIIVLASGHPEITLKATPSIIWPPNHRMVPVKIAGGVIANGSAIKSLSISVKDEYGKFNYCNLAFGRTVMLEAWRNKDDKDGRKYTITAVVRTKDGSTIVKTETVKVPYDIHCRTVKPPKGCRPLVVKKK